MNNKVVQPPLRKEIKSARSFALPIPANAMAFPGAKPAGDCNHLSKLASDHLRVALAERADEYAKPSPEAMLLPAAAPRAGPTEWAYMRISIAERYLQRVSGTRRRDS